MRPIKLIVLFVAVVAACARSASAQASSDAGTTPPDGVDIRVGYEARRDHLRFTFENPSNIDTDFPVPHSFTQQYVADNHWVLGSARYTIRDDVMQTEFGLTPERQTHGSDLDTFYDPDNDIVVSGTKGDVRLRSLRFTHWSEGRLFGLPMRVGYTFRRDRSQFLPTDRIVTHTNPPSEVRSPTLGHETTISQVHEIPIEVSRTWNISPSWKAIPSADVSPLILARLITKLPDKYPGRDITFAAKSIGVGGGVRLVRQHGWPLAVTIHYGQTWGYRAARQFRRDSLVAGLSFGG